MTSNLSDDLSRWFIQYWEFSEREADQNPELPKPFVGVLRYWPDWWDDLAIHQQLEIERLADALSRDKTGQESFANWLRVWLDGRGNGAGSFRVVLAQLAQSSLLRTWQTLDPFRLGANAHFLHEVKGRSSIDDVKPLIVVAAHEDTESDEPYYPINLEITEGLAKLALRETFKASLSAFQGSVFRTFLVCWIAFGRKNPDSPLRRALQIAWGFSTLGWVVVASLLVFVPTTELFGYFPDDDLLIPGLLALVLLPLMALLYAAAANAREALLAWSQGHVWARRLRQSRLYLLDGNQKTKKSLVVVGPSFGLMLCLSNLLALRAADPGEQSSWLWRELFAGLTKKLPHMSGTGEITQRGVNKRVERFKDKWEASRVHPMITEMLAPFQKETLLHWGSRPKPAMASATGEGHASGSSTIKLRHCGHLSLAMLTGGNLVNFKSVIGSLLVLSVSVVAYIASPDVKAIAFPSTPELLGYQVIIPDPEFHPDERSWLLTFRADQPDEFEVYDLYHHRTGRLRPSPKSPEYSVMLIALGNDDLTQPAAVTIELRQHRSLLGVSLPEKTVLLKTLF